MNKSLNITEKQQDILKLLYRFRFLKRSQIQKLLNHKDPKTINLWLKDLIEKEYIGIRKIGYPYKIAYCINSNGINYLKQYLKYDAKLLQKYYREKERSLSFITDNLLTADIYLDLAGRSSQKAKFDIHIKSDCPNHKYSDLLLALKPHAYITQTTVYEAKEYFVELISDQPKERLRQRIKNYLYFYQGMEWQEETGQDFPTILLICPSEELLEYIKGYAKRKLYQFDEIRSTINLTTNAQINQVGITGDIWKEI